MPASTAELSWLQEAVGGSVREFYAELGVDLPDRGGDESPVRCFANPSAHTHDDKKPSCSVNLLTGLFHCKGCGEKGNPYQAALCSGRTESAARDLAKRYGLFLETVKDDKPKARMPTERAVARWRDAMRDAPKVQARLAELKGWTPYGIQRLGVGWDGERVVFVVRNAKRKIVGVVRYLPGGSPKTVALPGSKRDLFPPPETIPQRVPLFIVEGEGDCVAVWSLGLRAVAVPGAGSWRKDWGARLMGRKALMLSDCDEQGRGLARRVSADAGVRWVDIEPGRDDHYDIGEMVLEASREGGAWQMRDILTRLMA